MNPGTEPKEPVLEPGQHGIKAGGPGIGSGLEAGIEKDLERGLPICSLLASGLQDLVELLDHNSCVDLCSLGKHLWLLLPNRQSH